jgi:hypothetical protein
MLIYSSSRPLGSHPGNRPESSSVILHYYRLIVATLATGPRPALSMAALPIRRSPKRPPQARRWAVCFALVCAVATAGAAGLNDLLNQKDLTPEGLAHGFADFAFELAPEVQEPEAFLQRKRGDCADYSNLASTVLTRHGYTTKLVVVMMSKQTHVVCYVKEAGGFLDYNHRADAHPLIASDGSLEDIAGKVAGDFRSQWRMASAFRYHSGSPVYLDSVFATGQERPAARKVVKNAVAEVKPLSFPAKTAAPAASLANEVGVQAMIN